MRMKLANTEIMISAAALITRAPVARPTAMALRWSRGYLERACSIWLIRKTW